MPLLEWIDFGSCDRGAGAAIDFDRRAATLLIFACIAAAIPNCDCLSHHTAHGRGTAEPNF